MSTVRWTVPCLVAVAVLAAPATARADAIDLWWLMTRSGGWEKSPMSAAVVAISLMGVNYLFNLVVVGIPARHGIAAARRSVRFEIFLLTLAAQVVDRIGCMGGLILGLLAVTPFVGGSEGLYWGLMIGLGLNFLFSGFGLLALVRRLGQRRWQLEPALVNRLSIYAAIFTNPGWLMFAVLLQEAR